MSKQKRTPTSQVDSETIIRRSTAYSKLAESRRPYSLNALAYRYGIANSTVNKLAHGWESKSLSAELVAEIRAAHQIGLMIDEELKADAPRKIAEDLGVCDNTVRNIYARHKASTQKVSKPKRPHIHPFLLQPLTPSPAPVQTYY